MIRVGVIGCGYWGPNLVRNFTEASGSTVARVSDLNPARLRSIGSRYPGIQTTTDYRDLFKDNALDAVAIATPASSHYALAMEALQAGKHVLVEKPLTASSTEAERLVEEAGRRNLILMVDHTFVYTGVVRKIRELTFSGKLGDLYYFDSVRVNLGLFQQDVNVIWDLAVHDLSILDYVLPVHACAVSATGVKHFPGGTENIAYITLFFESSLIAHVHVNWLAPVKVRRTLIGGSKQMIVYDDLENSEKLKVYDKGITFDNDLENVYKALVSYRTGDMWAPKTDSTEALLVEANHFIHCVESGERPITDGEAGLRVVRILEAATESMKHQGALVKLAG